MKLEWMGNHRSLIEHLIRFGNAYSSAYKVQQSYGTGHTFSASQIQTLEYILESEDKDEKMSEMAERLGVSRSTFSKNVKILTDKGLLEKYKLRGNNKDIYVKPSSKGHEVYREYVVFIQEKCFHEMFALLDHIPEESKANFERVLQCFSETLLEYGQTKPPEAQKWVRIE